MTYNDLYKEIIELNDVIQLESGLLHYANGYQTGNWIRGIDPYTQNSYIGGTTNSDSYINPIRYVTLGNTSGCG